MYKHLKTRQVGKVLWVELVNPPVNFLTTDMLAELFSVVEGIRTDDSVRVLVVTGGIDDTYIMHFSIPELARISADSQKTGMDRAVKTSVGRAILRSAVTLSGRLMDRWPAFEKISIDSARRLREKSGTLYLWLNMTRLYLAIERLDKITIAAINGPVNGGGVELSACFDFRFMVGDCGFTMGQPEVLVGIIPGGGSTQRLPRLIGRAKALEWMLRGNQLTPAEAKRLGLLTDVFKKKDFPAKVQKFAELMAKRPPVAVSAIKRAVRLGMETDLLDGLSVEMVESVRCFAAHDTKKALSAYMALIRERVEVEPEERIGPEELFDIMENALFVEDFEGK